MSSNDDIPATRARSKSYPAISLRQAVARCQTLYDKDGWNETPAETAAIHWGFQGLHGVSRPILSALKQYGLVEYLGSGDNLKVKLTDLGKRILRPISQEEKCSALQEAMQNPKLYASLYKKHPGWGLPSDATLSARLEREEGIQPKALKSLVADIKDSVAFLEELTSERGEAAEADQGQSSECISVAPKEEMRKPALQTDGPTVHLNLQIHISPDLSPEQIEKVFESMGKHIFGRG